MNIKMKTLENIKVESTDAMYFTFFTAYIALAGTTVITFIASLGDGFDKNTKYLKYSLVSETCVNIIAGLTYTYIMNLLDGKGLSLNKVTPIRYIDWFLTTPLLILSFVLYTNHYDNKERRRLDPNHINTSPNYKALGYIIPLNFLMLLFGFLGETGKLDVKKGLIYGFAAYAGLFAGIYEEYIKNNKDTSMKGIYAIFAFVWALYGAAYLLGTRNKNIAYNFLDVVSKVGFGILIWISTFSEDL